MDESVQYTTLDAALEFLQNRFLESESLSGHPTLSPDFQASFVAHCRLLDAISLIRRPDCINPLIGGLTLGQIPTQAVKMLPKLIHEAELTAASVENIRRSSPKPVRFGTMIEATSYDIVIKLGHQTAEVVDVLVLTEEDFNADRPLFDSPPIEEWQELKRIMLEETLSASAVLATQNGKNRAEGAENPRGVTKGANTIDKETEAIAALLTIGPNNTKISEAVGVPRTTLYGWPKFIQQYKKMKSKPGVDLPKGTKSKSGDFEAWDEN